MLNSTFTLACVVDRHPRFFVESVLWAHCVARHLPKSRFRAVVYFVEQVPPELGAWLASKGIDSATSDVMVPGAPRCNKIAALLDDHTTDYVLVSDVDLFFIADPSPLFRSGAIRAMPNNACNPPGWVFKNIFEACGMDIPFRPGVSLYRSSQHGGRESHINNVSAGLVGVPRAKSRAFAAAWKRWAQWLTDRQALMDRWSFHTAQISFCLAVEEFGEDVEFLPPQANTILQSLEEIDTVIALHLTPGHIPAFPHLFNADRTMNATGFSPGVVAAIDTLNESIEDAVRDLSSMAVTRDHFEYFLNPRWIR